ncbi:uncharacterized protein LAESUDRAFT_757714 [Laetiporus sulphureus 93-53]|uniref:Uncharacterized protein n=1 Tax=Laetiporus sulphureus 93-53 TaxID=1314785 RepID=A0A165F6E3_9APHY|nr:uncharacterized protein LAESUDRAFT_757714 [Laetiporus sulphureus 93-53]KZT08481.1 hypothetical protein LAESUDRAFT_757714 [Laetiporus sulphureus 93-53]
MVDHLRSLGFERDLDQMGQDYYILSQLPEVDIPAVLDPSEWTDIKPTIVELMDQRRSVRLFWECVDVVHQQGLPLLEETLSYLKATTEDEEPFPHPIDMAELPKVHEILASTTSAECKFEMLRNALPKLVQNWKWHVQAALQKQVGDETKQPGVKRLQYYDLSFCRQPAKLVFQCTFCGEIRHWPDVTSHYHPGAMHACYEHRALEYQNPHGGQMGFDTVATV